MSNLRSETNIVILATKERHKDPGRFELDVKDYHHLITVTKGSLKIQIGSSVWNLSPNRSILISNKTECQVAVDARTDFCKLCINPSDLILTDTSKLIDVTPLFRELVLHTTQQTKLDRNLPKDQHLFALLKDHLETEYVENIQIPLPKDERALKIYQLIVDKKQFDQPFESFVKKVGASKRTLERLFQNEVGMTFSKWRQLLRLQESLTLLDKGTSVAEVSEAVGYSSSSAFTHAFKNYFGHAPGQRFKKKSLHKS